MRAPLLLLLALVAALGAAGCGTGSGDPEQTALQPARRDLTLRDGAPAAVEVASPVELARAPAEPRAPRHVSHARRRAAVRVAPAKALASAPVAPPPAPVAAPAEAEAADPHALAPGQTVTVLTASTASPAGEPSRADWTDQLPATRGRGVMIGGGHGGGCRGGPSGGGFRGLR
jgi:hypothetical protein